MSSSVTEAIDPVIKRVHAIINPAAGQDKPILKTLNSAFQELGLEWEIMITKGMGDARRFAQEAVAAGVDAVAVYGGDGTVLEVASGLHGSPVALAILPGGTANVLSIELGIPRDLPKALALLSGTGTGVRAVDMGRLGEHHFFHLGLGLEGEMIKQADREAKDRAGLRAYILAMLRELRNPPVARYHLLLDDEQYEIEGINCMVTNFGSLGLGRLKLSHAIDISDGLLDVLVIQEINLRAILAALSDAITSGEVDQPMLQWQARRVMIEVDPPQSITIDGEVLEHQGRIEAEIVPQAVRVLVPVEAPA